MKCQIKWIDCAGNDTADTNDAVGYAVLGDKRFAICDDHLTTLNQSKLHHDRNCHCRHGHTPIAPWTFEPME